MEPIQDHLFPVRERHVLEHEGAVRPYQGAGVRRFRHVRLAVEEFEHAFGAGKGALERGELLSQRKERPVELAQIGHHEQQRAQRQ